jgi:hypothetical protein
MVAIGGWGDTESFSHAAKSERSRSIFADNVARMVFETGADGKTAAMLLLGGNPELTCRVLKASTSTGNIQGEHP